jgi:thiosulfate/3-mercaptopyruvate sulfurtransferase
MLRRHNPFGRTRAALGFLAAGLFSLSVHSRPEDPWLPAETVEPAQLLKELPAGQAAQLTLIYVGTKTLYAGAHIPGAVHYGPGSTEQGLSALKAFAASLPKSSDVVLYCGCCPLEKCPNLRPAFSALSKMGLARLRVLILPTSFARDWVEKGYPIHQGTSP